jgi:hypothetical protein
MLLLLTRTTNPHNFGNSMVELELLNLLPREDYLWPCGEMVTTTEEELTLFFKDLTIEHGGNNSDYKDNISSVEKVSL